MDIDRINAGLLEIQGMLVECSKEYLGIKGKPKTYQQKQDMHKFIEFGKLLISKFPPVQQPQVPVAAAVVKEERKPVKKTVCKPKKTAVKKEPAKRKRRSS